MAKNGESKTDDKKPEKDSDGKMKEEGKKDGDDTMEGDDEKKKRKASDDDAGNDEKNDGAAAETAPTPTNERSKRRRTSTQTAVYQPEDFLRNSHVVQIFRGRGAKLGDLVRDHIDSKYKINSEEMDLAHKFLYGKGSKNKAQLKSNIMEFSGFLRHYDEDKVDKETIDKEDENAEVCVYMQILRFLYLTSRIQSVYFASTNLSFLLYLKNRLLFTFKISYSSLTLFCFNILLIWR